MIRTTLVECIGKKVSVQTDWLSVQTQKTDRIGCASNATWWFATAPTPFPPFPPFTPKANTDKNEANKLAKQLSSDLESMTMRELGQIHPKLSHKWVGAM